MAKGMKTRYVCDECKKLMKPKDDILHIIGSRGELYLCKKCAKTYMKALKTQ